MWWSFAWLARSACQPANLSFQFSKWILYICIQSKQPTNEQTNKQTNQIREEEKTNKCASFKNGSMQFSFGGNRQNESHGFFFLLVSVKCMPEIRQLLVTRLKLADKNDGNLLKNWKRISKVPSKYMYCVWLEGVSIIIVNVKWRDKVEAHVINNASAKSSASIFK